VMGDDGGWGRALRWRFGEVLWGRKGEWGEGGVIEVSEDELEDRVVLDRVVSGLNLSNKIYWIS